MSTTEQQQADLTLAKRMRVMLALYGSVHLHLDRPTTLYMIRRLERADLLEEKVAAFKGETEKLAVLYDNLRLSQKTHVEALRAHAQKSLNLLYWTWALIGLLQVLRII